MKAVTLHRPYPWAILSAPVRPRRLLWLPSRNGELRELVGATIAIHAAACVSDKAAKEVRVHTGVQPEVGPRGIVALARVRGFVLESVIGNQRWRSRTLSDADLAAALASPWFRPGAAFGVLDAVEGLVRPVSARGRAGFWDMPMRIVEQIHAQLPGESPHMPHVEAALFEKGPV